MNDQYRTADELREDQDAAIEREMNPDFAALTDYLAGELPQEKAAEVRERLENDPEFREMAEPLLIAWSVPPKTQPESTEELHRAWLDLRRRAGMPLVPGQEEPPHPARRVRTDWARIGRGVLMAAGVVGIVTVPILTYQLLRGDARTLTTTSATRSTWTLPDGSRVALSEDTRVRIGADFAQTRRVELTGEARFDVVADRRTFVVVTSTATITVTGTSFTVQAYAKQPAEVAVHEGSVRVEPRDLRGKASAAVTLTAGQRARVTRHDTPEILP